MTATTAHDFSAVDYTFGPSIRIQEFEALPKFLALLAGPYTGEAVERGSDGGRRYAPVFVRIACKPPKIFRATREKGVSSGTSL